VLHLTHRGPLAPFARIRSIAVLRGGGLGDVLFATPALMALRATYPQARITLLGTALHADMLPGRFTGLDQVLVLPGVPGENGIDDADAYAALDHLSETVDLGVQIHGGGRNSNPFLLRLGARHTVGTSTPDAAGLERSIDYVYYQHEILRALEVVSLAGASPVTLEPSIAPTPADLDAGQRLAADLPGPVLALHPGASDPRRRWPRAHFAQVAAWAVNAGASVVVLGGPGENRAVAEIVNAAGRLSDRARIHGAADLTMSELIGGLAVADVLLGNDSGPRHLAQALATPTASVFWFGNLINAGPFTRQHHRVQMSWTSRCPVCKQDATRVGWTATRCEHDDSFVADVPVEAVCADVGSLMAMRVRSRDK